MAIVYSYPEGTPTLSDTVLGTQFDNNGNPTKSFSISDIIALVPSTAGFVPYTGATQSVDLGAFDLTATSIIKAGGTSAQYLMADGSISTAPSLTGFVPYVGATQNVNLGSFNLTATSIVKAGGTNLQYLLADGSVTTGPVLTGFIPYTGATQAVDLGSFNLTVNGISVGKGAGTGIDNTVVGEQAFILNTTGNTNTAIGKSALKNNTTGYWNTAIGTQSQEFGDTARGNISVGRGTLQNNLIGNFNTALGYKALFSNLADKNTAIGPETMFTNTTGTFNTVVGQEALRASIAGSYNSILGNFAILNAEASYVSALGRDAGRYSSAANLLTISESIFIGFNSKSLNTTSTNEIVIGANAVGEGDNTTTIGHTTITSTRLRGTVKGGSFVKDGGTASQYLMADGTTTTAVKSTYTMTGVFANMFGGDPGGLNKDILEWSPTTPAASHSSVLPILQNCRITAAGFKWISSTAIGTINVGDSWTVNLYKMTNPLTGSTTADGNFTLVGSLNITLTSANSGTTPGIFSSSLNLVLAAGDIIRIAGNETGTIGTSTEEAQLSVLFEVI